MDVTKYTEQIVGSVKDYLRRNLAPIAEQVKALVARIDALPVPRDGEKGEPGERGERGADGKSVEHDAVVADVLAKMPVPQDGRQGEKGEPGQDGKSVNPEDVKALVDQAVAALPKPENGTHGEKGEPGADGRSVDPEQVAEMVQKAVAALPAPKDGEKGERGIDADPKAVAAMVSSTLEAQLPSLIAKGVAEALPGAVAKAIDALMPELIAKAAAAVPKPRDGQDGKDGAPVAPEVVEALVVKHVATIPRPQNGKAGEKGDAGEDGRDAAQIEVLDAIEPARRYQRGVFAIHRGGLVRSRRATEFLGAAGTDLEKAGWQVILNGAHQIELELEADMRTVILRSMLTDGSVREQRLRLPTTIYRGIWKDGEAYTLADSATRDGSTWILMADEQKGKPGDEGSGWLLSCKRGRDGRDGLKGEKGERGAEGRAGKDLTQRGPDGSRW